MDKKIWPINDNLYCQMLTAEYLEEALDLMDIAFFPYENICRVVGVANDKEALKELRDLTRATAHDGVTVIAIDKTTNKVVGACFNKLQVKDDHTFEILASSWKRPISLDVVKFMAKLENSCNLFDQFQVNCFLDLMFLITLPEYGRRGIGKKLSEITIEIAKNLKNGVNVKQSVDGTKLSLDPVPGIITSIFTTIATQKIGKELGFQVLFEKKYDELKMREYTFEEVPKSGTSSLLLEYYKL